MMKLKRVLSFTGALACMLLAIAGGAPTPASAAAAADAFCPNAAPLLTAYADVTKNSPNDAEKILTAAKNLQSVYHDCGAGFISSGSYEPAAHYCQIREAQFAYAAARSEIVLKQFNDAHADAELAFQLASLIVNWKPNDYAITLSAKPDQSGSARVSTTSNSNYHDTAVQVRDAADQMLKIFQPVAPASPAP